MTRSVRTRSARVLGTAAALLVAAAGALAVTTGAAAPAQAAACTSGKGVTVVVDRGALGGGVSAVCVGDGAGQSAWALLDGAFGVDGVQRQPGFICRVGGAPADAACVNTPPADAYWGIYHSNGRSGAWTYSSTGAGSLYAVEGGYVAASWQDGGAADAPGLTPAAHPAPTTKPTPTRTPTPTTSTPTPDTDGTTDEATDAGPAEQGEQPVTAKGGAKDGKKAGKNAGKKDRRKRPQGDATTTAPGTTEVVEDETEPTSAESGQSDEGGIPAAVTFGVLGALVVAGGAAAVVSRRRRDA